MAAAVALYRTTIGKKTVMALTGFVLVGFVIVHMLGNMKIYLGAEEFNAYAAGLRSFGAPLLPHELFLWIARVVLLTSVVLHMVAAYQLTMLDKASRPQNYAVRKNTQATYASLTMRWGGIILILFIIYHILHFTVGAVGYQAGQFVEGSVYQNVIAGFSVWYVSAFYVVAMAALAMHLYHGVWSMFQTLGLSNGRRRASFRSMALAVAAVVFLGNISVPLAVLAGVVK